MLDRQYLAKVLDDLAAILLDIRDILLRSVKGLVLAGFAREENKTSVVGLEALNVGSQTFGGKVGTARIDGDTNSWSQLAGYTSFLVERI